jgi:hypothetical protein
VRLRELITAPSDARGEPEAAALLHGDPGRSAGERLAVYAFAWFERLHGVLASDFGALAQLLGPAGFRALARDYLSARPPARPSLRDAGECLPGFLAQAPAAAEIVRRHPFAPDLARLERAIVEAFDAADAPTLAREALATLPPEAWAELRLRFQPAVRLLELSFPVGPLRLAHDREEASLPVGIQPRPTPVCVWRKDERVFHRELDPVEAEALDTALAGASFGLLCETIAARLSDEEAPARAAELLARWQQDGWLALQR